MTAQSASRARDRQATLILDPGALEPTEVLEIGGWQAPLRHGGVAVLPRRDHCLAARASGVEVHSSPETLRATGYRQAVVHLEKGRTATWWALAKAWNHLQLDGRLLFVGSNDLGVKSAVRRLARELGQEAVAIANRARARVVSFVRTAGPGPRFESPESIRIQTSELEFQVETCPGAFSADGLDPGSRLLIDHLAGLPEPSRVFDPGSGLGVLGLAALLRFSSAEACLAEIDRRAVEASRLSARRLELTERCRVTWWDAGSEPPPIAACDLVVLNPPFHAGRTEVNLEPAYSMFHAIDATLEPGGSALVVANRTLPYEQPLRALGRLEHVAERDGFKLLRVHR